MAGELKDMLKMIGIAILTIIADAVFGYALWYVIKFSISFGIEFLFVGGILALLIPWNYFVFSTLFATIKKYREYKKNKKEKE